MDAQEDLGMSKAASKGFGKIFGYRLKPAFRPSVRMICWTQLKTGGFWQI